MDEILDHVNDIKRILDSIPHVEINTGGQYETLRVTVHSEFNQIESLLGWIEDEVETLRGLTGDT